MEHSNPFAVIDNYKSRGVILKVQPCVPFQLSCCFIIRHFKIHRTQLIDNHMFCLILCKQLLNLIIAHVEIYYQAQLRLACSSLFSK